MIINNINLHLQGIKAALASRMAYRGDFFMSMLIMLLVESFAPLITILVYKNGAAFPGWTMYEVLLLQGIFLLARGISFPFFFGMVWNTLGRVREGTLDLLLLKPRPILQMLIVTGFDSEDLGKLIGGALIFTLSLRQIPTVEPLQVLKFTGVFTITMLLLFGFAVILSGIGIIWVGNGRVYEIFFTVTNFGMYPASIFSKVLQSLITWIIPVAILGSVPASVLLGKSHEGFIPAITGSLLFLLAGLAFWSAMLKRYTSAGG